MYACMPCRCTQQYSMHVLPALVPRYLGTVLYNTNINILNILNFEYYSCTTAVYFHTNIEYIFSYEFVIVDEIYQYFLKVKQKSYFQKIRFDPARGYCLRLYAGIPASGRKCVYILVLCKIWPITQIFSIFYKFDINIINRRDPVSNTLSDNMN